MGVKDKQKHAGNITRNNGNYGHEKGQSNNKYGCDIMPKERGLINPKLCKSSSDDEMLLQ